MKKILLSAIYLLVSILTFAQTNPVKVADFFADFEIKPYNGNVMDTVYNTGVDVTLPVFVRFKLKGPYGSGNFVMVPQKSAALVLYEHANGFDFNPTGNPSDLTKNEWLPMPGSIYSPYVKVDLTLYKEYLKSGKLKTHFMSQYDPVNNSFNPGVALVANYTRNITVIQVSNFIGPNQICDEATYTIERPDAITLQNAAGIATLTALGNNQWKVTRIGTANGPVKLRSTSSGRIYEKEIMIGGSLVIGFDNLNNMQAFDYENFKVLPGTGSIKYDGSMTITNVNSTGTTNYNWSLVSKSPGSPIVSWSDNGPNISVSSKGSGGWVKLKCEITNGCVQETRYYNIYVGIDPLMP